MKKKLVVAALVVATIAALAISLTAFAQTQSTTGSTNSSGCTLIDPESASAGNSGTSGTSSSTGSGSSAATPAAAATSAATATTAPAATTTTAPVVAATAAPTTAATSAPTATTSSGTGGTTGTAAPSTGGTGSVSTPAATPSPTATTSSGSSSSGSTGTSGLVSDPHENPFCANGFKADVAVPNGGSVALSSGSANGVIPVTGNSSSSNSNGNRLNTFTAVGSMMTLKIMDKTGNPATTAHMEVCFVDKTQSANISQWYDATMWSTWYKSSTTPARWVRLPTSHTGDMACAQSWLPGTFALVP